MICTIIFLALSQISSAAVISPLVDRGLTTIEWTSANSSDGIPNLSINFRDGSHYEAALNHLDLYSEELRSSGLSSDHLCIFEGSLITDLDSQILLIGGCPGSNTFEIAMTGKSLGSLRLKVVDGIVTEIPRFNNDFLEKGRIDSIETTDAQRHSKSSTSRINDPLPSAGFIYKIGIIYDNPWLQTHGSHTESVNAATRVVAEGQVFFYWPSLTIPIKLQIASITHQDVRLTTRGSELSLLIPFAKDPTINTYVGMTTAEGGGVAYVGTICAEEMKYRTALIGKPVGSSEALAGEVLGHELGHSLGAPHDFIGPHKIPKTIRYDSTGNSCTNINALMDYDKTKVALWSRCSVEEITKNYNNIIAAQGKFCMAIGRSCGAIPPWSNFSGLNEWCNNICKNVQSFCPSFLCQCSN